jgi:hypothetical protein
LLATVTILGNVLVSASGGSREFYRIPGFLAPEQGDQSIDLGPGTSCVEVGLSDGDFGTFTMSSQGTVDATTGALMATGNSIDFNLSQLAAITINAGDWTSPQGMPEEVGIDDITNNQHDNDTFYLPTGTYSFDTLPGLSANAFGTFTVAQDASGSFSVSATTGALVANGGTIELDLTQLAAITISELTDSAGLPEAINVGGVGVGIIGSYGPTGLLPTRSWQRRRLSPAIIGSAGLDRPSAAYRGRPSMPLGRDRYGVHSNSNGQNYQLAGQCQVLDKKKMDRATERGDPALPTHDSRWAVRFRAE